MTGNEAIEQQRWNYDCPPSTLANRLAMQSTSKSSPRLIRRNGGLRRNDPEGVAFEYEVVE